MFTFILKSTHHNSIVFLVVCLYIINISTLKYITYIMWNVTLKIRANWPMRSLVSYFVRYERIGLQHHRHLSGTSISVISETSFNLDVFDNFYRS